MNAGQACGPAHAGPARRPEGCGASGARPIGSLRRALAAAALLAAAAAAAPALATDYDARFKAECTACHGPGGVSVTPGTPTLAGQPSFYAVTQLFLFRAGRRDNAAMSAVGKGMSDDDLRGFSEAIARLPAAPAVQHDKPADAAMQGRGARLAAKLHCGGCHGRDFGGGDQVPRLAGQREEYLLSALEGFRSARRLGYTQAMNEALAGVDGQGLKDLAHYLARFEAPVRPAGATGKKAR